MSVEDAAVGETAPRAAPAENALSFHQLLRLLELEHEREVLLLRKCGCAAPHIGEATSYRGLANSATLLADDEKGLLLQHAGTIASCATESTAATSSGSQCPSPVISNFAVSHSPIEEAFAPTPAPNRAAPQEDPAVPAGVRSTPAVFGVAEQPPPDVEESPLLRTACADGAAGPPAPSSPASVPASPKAPPKAPLHAPSGWMMPPRANDGPTAALPKHTNPSLEQCLEKLAKQRECSTSELDVDDIPSSTLDTSERTDRETAAITAWRGQLETVTEVRGFRSEDSNYRGDEDVAELPGGITEEEDLEDLEGLEEDEEEITPSRRAKKRKGTGLVDIKEKSAALPQLEEEEEANQMGPLPSTASRSSRRSSAGPSSDSCGSAEDDPLARSKRSIQAFRDTCVHRPSEAVLGQGQSGELGPNGKSILKKQSFFAEVECECGAMIEDGEMSCNSCRRHRNETTGKKPVRVSVAFAKTTKFRDSTAELDLPQVAEEGGDISKQMSRVASEDKAKFKLREIWNELKQDNKRQLLKMTSSPTRDLSAWDTGDKVDKSVCVGFRPGKRVFQWDCFALMFAAYDWVALPLLVFWMDLRGAAFSMYVVTTLFWSLDVFRNLFVGYHDKGAIVVDLKRVLKRYAKTCMLFDLLSLTADWIRISTNMVSWPESMTERAFYFFHFLRLSRVWRMAAVLRNIQERINLESASNLMTIVEMFFLLVLLNHIIGCGWYYIGTRWALGGDSWVTAFLMTTDGSENLPYIYMTAFHWSLTQFTPASIAVQPSNLPERIYSVVVLLGALVVFSTFLSGITGAMMHIRGLRAERSKKFWMLRRYLKEAHVPMALSIRIQQFIENEYNNQESFLQEGNVEVLALISNDLRAELQVAICEPRLCGHPLMLLVATADYPTMLRICNKACQRTAVGRHETLFQAAEEANCVSFVCDGTMRYAITIPARGETEAMHVSADVVAGMWVGEATMWTQWFYLGELTAVTACEVVAVDVLEFHASIPFKGDLQREVLQYAKSFITSLNRAEGLYFRLMSGDIGEQGRKSTRASLAKMGKVTKADMWIGMLMHAWHSLRGHNGAEDEGDRGVADMAAGQRPWVKMEAFKNEIMRKTSNKARGSLMSLTSTGTDASDFGILP
eukprot:TRINITY_DN4045_c0_g1_i3.p1 TRINITY_DN4045_c0_g1~~TRINITY_DN4045_c0_g1_i3.p1  ORF type:complete len:1133 (+),score=295.61 TRINITY_DN4045_c0_g1_i3:119-3517(+)